MLLLPGPPMSDTDSRRLLIDVPQEQDQSQQELQLVRISQGSLDNNPPSLNSSPTKLSKRNSSERSLPLRSYSKWAPMEQGATLGTLFIMISENTYHPMYSVLNVFPQGFPLFMRETRSGLYSTAQYYVANILAMLPGMIIEPFLFVVICYWITGLRATYFAFGITAICVVLVMNVATACGCFFSTAFNSVPLAMAYLVPLDYIFMITSGIFIKISSLPVAFYWTQFVSWMLYANEAMTIAQWSGVQNITCFNESPDLPCFHTGQDVLDKYSFEEAHLYRNLWAILLIYFGFHLLAYYFLWRRARKI